VEQEHRCKHYQRLRRTPAHACARSSRQELPGSAGFSRPKSSYPANPLLRNKQGIRVAPVTRRCCAKHALHLTCCSCCCCCTKHALPVTTAAAAYTRKHPHPHLLLHQQRCPAQPPVLPAPWPWAAPRSRRGASRWGWRGIQGPAPVGVCDPLMSRYGLVLLCIWGKHHAAFAVAIAGCGVASRAQHLWACATR